MKIQKLPARTGMHWLQLGWQTFWRQPLALGLLFSLWIAGPVLVALIPVVGLTLSMALQPLLMLTLLVAVSQAVAGQRAGPALLLAFRCSRAQQRGLLALSALYALVWLGLLGLTALFDGGSLASAYVGMDADLGELLTNPPAPSVLTRLLNLALLLCLLIWPASGLVYWHGISPIKAVFLSAAAGLRNWRAFLVFGLVSTGVVVALLLGNVLFFALLGLVTGMSEPPVTAFMVGLISSFTVYAAISMTAIFFSFRDCFGVPAAPQAAPPAPT